MTVITIYSLFFDDIRSIAFSLDVDPIMYGISAGVLGCFLLEIVIACIVVDDYFLSFFFWLDVVASLSMVADIGWLWQAMTGGS